MADQRPRRVRWVVATLVGCLLLASGCRTTYYKAWEQFGVFKRDLWDLPEENRAAIRATLRELPEVDGDATLTESDIEAVCAHLATLAVRLAVDDPPAMPVTVPTPSATRARRADTEASVRGSHGVTPKSGVCG